MDSEIVEAGNALWAHRLLVYRLYDSLAVFDPKTGVSTISYNAFKVGVGPCLTAVMTSTRAGSCSILCKSTPLHRHYLPPYASSNSTSARPLAPTLQAFIQGCDLDEAGSKTCDSADFDRLFSA